MSFSRKSRRPDIGNPDLHRPQALAAQTLSMVGDPLTNLTFGHTARLHVTARRHHFSRTSTDNHIALVCVVALRQDAAHELGGSAR